MFLVTYNDESGNQAQRTFEREDDAIAAFLAYFPDTDSQYSFPASDAWDFIGWMSETTGLYGFSDTLPHTEDHGIATVSLTYTREHTAGCRCHALDLTNFFD